MKLHHFAPTLLSSVVMTAAAEASTLQTWRFDVNQNQIELQTDTGVQPQAFLIFNPTRLVIDLPNVRIRGGRQTQELSGSFRAIRLAQFEQQTARLVVELAPGYSLDPNKVRFRGIYANQWVVQLPTPQRVEGAVSPLPAAVPSPQSAVTVPLPEKILPPRSPRPTPGLASGFPPVVQGARSVNSQWVIVIDPGHGGPDPGAVGIGGLREVDVLMPVSLQLAALLRQQGFTVVMTREDDRDLDLAPRVQIAERANADIFISIHANAISMARPDVNGIETYYHVTGKQLAESIQRNLIQATGMRSRGVKRSRFFVLRQTSMPSVLIELGFVTGAEDAPRLRDPQTLQQMAAAIAQGVLEYVQTQAR